MGEKTDGDEIRRGALISGLLSAGNSGEKTDGNETGRGRHAGAGEGNAGRDWEMQLEQARLLCEGGGFSREVNLKIVDVGEGFCVGKVEIEKRHLNPLNTVHGGVFFTLADTVCGIAAASTGYGGPTVQGDMDYMRPVGGKEIVCTARVLKTGRTLTWVEGVLTDDAGTEVARTKFIYYRLKETKHFGFAGRE